MSTAAPVRPAVRVAVAQVEVGADRAANRAAAAAAVDDAARVRSDLVVLPEYASAYDRLGVGVHLAEPLDGPFVGTLRERAAATGVAVIAGTSLPCDDPRLAVNAVVAIAGDGAIAGVYRKVHLYDAFGTRESDVLEAGPADAEPLVLPVGAVTVGVLTCYDLRFPESARRVVDAGADVLVVPAAWVDGPLKAMQWRALAVARAIESTAAVVAVGMAGRGVTGRSLVVGPDGVVLLELGEEPALAWADLDPGRIAEVRATNPSLANRRYRVLPA
ncbi:MAG TPA: carbon-nitrogen hydrolase family protein [Cellulomonas sp.]